MKFDLFFASSLLLSFLLFSDPAFAQQQRGYNAAEIQLALRKLQTAGTVLYVAAHPDDENTRLLSYLANEKCVRTAYISLTRGDGGQNLIGQEQGPLLGLIRSFELMAARNVDGAEQYFTRAYDFGYSKSPEETYAIWDKDSVLADLTFIIRHLRPDLVITRFATDGSGGHGHHTASAMLAEEAFAAAASNKHFPGQLKHVAPWQAKSLLYNNAARFRNPNADMTGNIALNVGKYNPLLGRSYGEIAGLSRSMHKSQGFGSANAKGDVIEYFKPILGAAPKQDIFEGIDLSLNRIPGARKFSTAVEKAVSAYRPDRPDLILPQLFDALEALREIRDPYWLKIKRKQVEDLILACSGTWIEVNSKDPTAAPGEEISLQTYAINRSPVQVLVERIDVSGLGHVSDITLTENQLVQQDMSVRLPDDISWSGPYWLRSWPEKGVFQLDSQAVLLDPVQQGALHADVSLLIGGHRLTIRRSVTYKWVDPVQGEQFRLFEVTPPVLIQLPEQMMVFNRQQPGTFKVILKAGKAGVNGRLRLQSTGAFTYKPAYYDFSIDTKNAEQTFVFEVDPGRVEGKFPVNAEVLTGDKIYDRSMLQIKYDHIPIQLIFPKAAAHFVNLNIVREKNRIGYIPGAGDDIPSGLRQMGYQVQVLDDETLDKADITSYEAIVTGIRAFNTNERLVARLPVLMDYVAQGGTLVVQYNTNSWAGPLKGAIGPYPFEITRNRVTDENAPVSFTQPVHEVLLQPNRIGPEDFEGWIQERGLYFGGNWDPAYATPLAMSDPGESAQAGSLLLAQHGKGHFVYTGLSFFRQIPNGTPGAFRLLANLIELGNKTP